MVDKETSRAKPGRGSKEIEQVGMVHVPNSSCSKAQLQPHVLVV